MLSSQTKDPVTHEAVRRLRSSLPGGLSVESVLAVDEAELAQLLHPVGFYRNKARFLKAASAILREKHGGDVPSSLDALMELPGVGPKMAFLVLSVAFGKTEGICVDTHVHRISNRLGWVRTWNHKNESSQDPERTRVALQQWLPREFWGPINVLLVGFGQQVCTPRQPKCHECPVRLACPSAPRSARK